MMFEYDKLKSKVNKEKHGIDFVEAQQLWKDPERIVIPTKFLYESRYVLIGKNKNKHWAAVFTYRNNNVRLISVRWARKNEKEIYES